MSSVSCLLLPTCLEEGIFTPFSRGPPPPPLLTAGPQCQPHRPGSGASETHCHGRDCGRQSECPAAALSELL